MGDNDVSGTEALAVKEELTRLVREQLVPKTFSSGSTGYLAMGRVVIGEKRYQVNVQVVLIGSKPQVRS